MRCDDVRKLVEEGAPLDEAARGHLAACAECGEEFAALRALTSSVPVAPAELRGRVLAAFPSPRAPAWQGFVRAAAVLIIGIGAGFFAGYAIKPPRMIEVPGEPVVLNPQLSDDYVSNVGIAAERVYGGKRKDSPPLVEVKFVPNSVRIQSIIVDPILHTYEKYCPVARQLGSLAEKRPDVVVYKKKEY